MPIKILRWFLCFIVTVIQAGAFLEHSWGTAITGLLLALFLTVDPAQVRARTKYSYWLVLSALIMLFFAGSVFDIRNS